MALYLANHPDEIAGLVSSVCSEAFAAKFNMVSVPYTPEGLDVFLNDIYQSDELLNYEKAVFNAFSGI